MNKIETLISDITRSHTTLLALTESKSAIELTNMDINSKDTLTKQYNLLKTTIPEYANISNDIDRVNSALDILKIKVGLYKSIAPLFKNITEFENYIN